MLRRGSIALLLLVTACEMQQTAAVQRSEETALGGLMPGEAITIVTVSPSSDPEIVRCVESALLEQFPQLRIVAEDEFRDALFPWFEPGTAPTSSDALASVLGRPVVRQRIAAFGIRFVIALEGGTVSRTESWGTPMLGGGLSVEKVTRLRASVLDIASAEKVADVQASASGQSAGGVVLFVPYAVVAPTESVTCKALAERIDAVMSGSPAAPH